MNRFYLTVNQESGFTLIELVMVIVLLGILAAVALPRMMNNYDEAHYSSVAATGGALSSAVMLVRSQWVSNGAKGEVDVVNGYGQNDVATTLLGWPSDAQKGGDSVHSSNLAGDAQRCLRIWQSLLVSNGMKVATEFTTGLVYLVTAPTKTICTYTYQLNDFHSRIEYDLSSGAVLTVLK
jgi:prepilin-type N-terminal cleavage/methylation domain-containing protein